MVMMISKSLTMIKCTSDATRFNGRADAPVQYRAHFPMERVHGYPGCHWMLPPGEYSLRIAPAAARATAHKTTIKKINIIASRFDSRADAPVRYHVHCPIEVVQGFN